MTSVFIRRDNKGGEDHDIILESGSNLYTGEDYFDQTLDKPTTLERDLLLIGSAIFAADRACLRGERALSETD